MVVEVNQVTESVATVLGELIGSNPSGSRRQEIFQNFQRIVSDFESIIHNRKHDPQLYGSIQFNPTKLIVCRLQELTSDAKGLLDELVNGKVRFPLSSRKTNEIRSLRRKFGDFQAAVDDGQETYPSLAEEDTIVGRKADKDTVVDMLLMSASASASNSSILPAQEHLSAVCIVGMGGVGKTTLAQLVLHDPRIQAAFDLRLWGWVGVFCTIRRILHRILREGTVVGSDDLDLDTVKAHVKRKINGKRVLLVLDYVWCETPNMWHELTHYLAFTVGRGSQILVTSCSMGVADLIGNGRIHELKGLSQEDSWNLFYRVAFSADQEPDAELVRIAKQVTLKCANHPLTIRMVASLLYGQDISKWLLLKHDNLINISPITKEISPKLLKSFYLLTPELRKCFEFFSVFPKDHVIEKQGLIDIWLALDYVAPVQEAQTMEEIAEAYWSMLSSRFFFQDIEKDEYGTVISFKMHDLLHDLARQEARGEILILTDTNTHHLQKKIRHLFVSKSASSIDLFGQPYAASETLDTIFNLREYAPCSFNHVAAILSQCKRLRLLDLRGVAMETLPDTFDKVPHLRYLDLSDNEKLEKLPASITMLSRLHVLRLRGCRSLEELPEDLSKLVQLRILDIDGCNKLTSMPPGMDNLTCLRTLTMFVVGGDDVKQGNRGKLADLKALVNLKGDLLIKVGKFSTRNTLNATRASIVKHAQIQDLEIICEDGSFDHGDVHERLLKSLYPHHGLRRIVIQGYQGTKLPSWVTLMTNSFPNIVSITLSHFRGLQHLTTLSQLHHLKYLCLVKLWKLESIEGNAPSEFMSGATKSTTFFPSLEKLVLEWMPKLKGWWRDLTWMEMEADGGCLVYGNGHNMKKLILPAFSHLIDLSIRFCPSITYFPPCPHVKRLELRGVNELCMRGSTLPNPVATESSNSKLEKLIVYYNARVFDSLFGNSVVPRAVDIDIKYFFQEESLQLAGEAFQRCSSSLRRLSIDGFYKLKSLSGGGIEHLTNLQSLSVKECLALDLEDMPWKSLYTLSSLKLDDIPKLVNLPKGFQYLTALQSLHIKSCKNLKALGECIGSLTSLQSLHIEDCNNLKSLPECLGSLTSLQSIHVDECNNLEALPECLNSLLSRQILHIKNT